MRASAPSRRCCTATRLRPRSVYSSPRRPQTSHTPCDNAPRDAQSRRRFHDYFVTHLPSSSLHPDAQSTAASHKLPRDQSTPHGAGSSARSPASLHHAGPASSRDLTVVRIPLNKAKHHYGAATARGTRPYNEDTYQAGTVEIPAFAKRGPISLTVGRRNEKEAKGADSASGDPQVFYFGVFDGHGGDKCSHFLRDQLHTYIERSAEAFGLRSSLRKSGQESEQTADGARDPGKISKDLVAQWRDTVGGGYFRRFKPEYFAEADGGKGMTLLPSIVRGGMLVVDPTARTPTDISPTTPSVEKVLTHTFLKADFDFVTAQTENMDDEDDYDISGGRHHHHSDPPFLGGSTCSLILISTPTPTPFWHPSTPLTVLTAHIGDTRIIMCDSATGAPVPMTADHHPSSPGETTRLRRYSAAFTTDSFGEERILGLANTRAFGDVRSKRIGVTAEPELRLMHLAPASYSFLVLVSDGVTSSLSDQEIVDVVKEAKTPEQASRSVVDLATELADGEKGQADNATALVVRLGGWERRNEGGMGSLGTKEQRDWRRSEAMKGGGRRT